MKKVGSVMRPGAHGLILLGANLIAIIGGFLIYDMLRPADQLAIQIPIGVVSTIIIFVVWSYLFRLVPLIRRFALRSRTEFVWTFLFSLVWGPAVSIPLHFFTQGYLTGMGNIVALLMFQIPVNTIALLIAWAATNPQAICGEENVLSQIEPTS